LLMGVQLSLNHSGLMALQPTRSRVRCELIRTGAAPSGAPLLAVLATSFTTRKVASGNKVTHRQLPNPSVAHSGITVPHGGDGAGRAHLLGPFCQHGGGLRGRGHGHLLLVVEVRLCTGPHGAHPERRRVLHVTDGARELSNPRPHKKQVSETHEMDLSRRLRLRDGGTAHCVPSSD
jgi:hypothetical protein